MCFGQCLKENIVLQQENAKRDPLNGFRELILSQVDKIIDDKLNRLKINFEASKAITFKNAFLEGFKEGIKEGIKIMQYIDTNEDNY